MTALGPLSHLLINCLIGAAMWAGIIALIVRLT